MKLNTSQKLEQKNDGSSSVCPRTVFLCSGARSVLGNGSVNAHKSSKQRWQFCAFSIEALAGQCHLNSILDAGLGFGLLCSSAEQAESFPY